LADLRISELPDGTTAQPTDVIPIVRAGENYKLPLSALSPAADTQVLFKDGTLVAGSADFVFNKTLKQIVLGAGVRVLLPEGTAPATPTIQFGATGTGLFTTATLPKQVHVASDGLIAARFAASGAVIGTAGLTFSGSANTLSLNDILLSRAAAGQLLQTSAGINTSLLIRAASAQAANLQEWQNSSDVALTSVDKDGVVRAADAGYVFTNSTAMGMYRRATNFLAFKTSGLGKLGLHEDQITLISNQNLGWAASSDPSSANETYLTRAAAGQMQLGSSGTDTVLIVKAGSAQSANLHEWRNSSGTPLAVMTKDGYLNVGANQVLSARKTGWGAPTGTPTRTAFDTTTVTLPQLAERLKALIDDLALHGLIGA